MENQNLSIWDQVQKTDPNYTKQFRRAGGFQGVAIDPMYNVYRATSLFGPIGIGWGYEIIEENLHKGAPIYDKKENVVGNEMLHEVKLRIWYVHNGQKGELTSSGATMLVGKNKYGYVTDEEAVKKSITDALGKGLSWLGFSADVHLGKFDDSKYVQGLKAEFSQSEQKKNAGQTFPTQSQADKKEPGQNAQAQAPSNGSHESDLPKIEGVEFKRHEANGRVFFIASGNLYGKAEILKGAGFRWNPNQKCWFIEKTS